jgi:peptidoglycan/LPS O-acetylase OafA/YrhL
MELIWHIGRLGVLMFFVHTSLVLMFSMERLPLKGWDLIKSFYVRRAFRIYPLSMLCVMVYYGWLPTFWAPARNWTQKDLWANLTLSQNLLARDNVVGVLWSLPLEIQMYVCLPVLFLFCRTRSVWLIAGIWLASIPIAMLPSFITERLNFFEYVPCFLAGVMAWRLIQQFHTRILPAWLWPVSLALPAAIWLAGPQEHSLPFRWLCALALGLLIPFFRELQWKPLNRCSQLIAKYSYGIYLVHLGGLVLVDELRKYHPAVPGGIRWTLCALIVIVAPVLLYHSVEEPLIRVGRRVAERLTSWKTAPMAISALPGPMDCPADPRNPAALV